MNLGWYYFYIDLLMGYLVIVKYFYNNWNKILN